MRVWASARRAIQRGYCTSDHSSSKRREAASRRKPRLFERFEPRVMLSAGFAGDSLATALELDVDLGIVTVVDELSESQEVDYYRFELDAPSDVELLLSGHVRSVELELRNEAGAVIEDSDRGGLADEFIDERLDAGVYFVRVEMKLGPQTPYVLDLSAVPVAGPTPETARQLGVINDEGALVVDTLGFENETDYFAFTLTQERQVDVVLSGLFANADLLLAEADGGVIATSQRGRLLPETIWTVLEPGDYLVRVDLQGFGSTPYELVIATAEPDPGPTPETARDLGVLTTPVNGVILPEGVEIAPLVEVQEDLHRDDERDVYRFELLEPTVIDLLLSGLSADADVTLTDGDGRALASSDRAFTRSEGFIVDLDAGEYFIIVDLESVRPTHYELSLAAVLPDPGSTLETARDLGVLVPADVTPALIDEELSGAEVTGALGGEDRTDIYRFELLDEAVLDLELTGLLRNVDVTLLDADGRPLADSERGGARSESLSATLDAGVYYIALDIQSLGFTPYELDLVVNTPGVNPFLGVIDGELIRIEGAVDRDDRVDEFGFELFSMSDFVLTLLELTGDVEVELIDLINGRVVAETQTFGGRVLSIERVLEPGLYSVRVTHEQLRPAVYEMTLLAEPHAGDTPATAADLGLLRSSLPLSAVLLGPAPPIGFVPPPVVPIIPVIPISSLPPLREVAPLIASSETFTPSGLPLVSIGTGDVDPFVPLFGGRLRIFVEG